MCGAGVWAEILRSVASRLVSELRVIKSAEHLAILLDTTIYELKDLNPRIDRADIHKLLLYTDEMFPSLKPLLAGMLQHEERIVSDPRFTSLKPFIPVIKEFIGSETPRELPWRSSTYNHLRRTEEETFTPEIEIEVKTKKKGGKALIWALIAVAALVAVLLLIILK